MLIENNNIIKIERLVESQDWKKTYNEIVIENLPVYIEPLSEEVMVWTDWIWAYEWNKLMSDYLDIKIWDKITDKYNRWMIVKWIKIYENVVWKHLEAIILNKYD